MISHVIRVPIRATHWPGHQSPPWRASFMFTIATARTHDNRIHHHDGAWYHAVPGTTATVVHFYRHLHIRPGWSASLDAPDPGYQLQVHLQVQLTLCFIGVLRRREGYYPIGPWSASRSTARLDACTCVNHPTRLSRFLTSKNSLFQPSMSHHRPAE